MMDSANMPVVVGVDGSASALSAVRLATREAARRRRDLRLVHAFIWPRMHVDVRASVLVPESGLRYEAERILAEAAATAATTDDGVAVTMELTIGMPVPVLLAAAQQAELLVIGDRGLGGFTGLLLGSVAVQATSHSETPVLVARGEEHPAGPVVLGVDDSPDSKRAIEEAFAEAELRDADLLAVRVWTQPVATTPVNMLPLAHEPELAKVEEQQVLATALSECRERYPKVRLREEVIAGRAARMQCDSASWRSWSSSAAGDEEASKDCCSDRSASRWRTTAAARC